MAKPAAAKCARCKHPSSKHTTDQRRQCAVKVTRAGAGPSGWKRPKLILCDCPGYLAELPALPPLRAVKLAEGMVERNG